MAISQKAKDKYKQKCSMSCVDRGERGEKELGGTYLKINSWLQFSFSHYINNTVTELCVLVKNGNNKNCLVMICSSLFPLAEQAQRFTFEIERKKGKALITP